MPLNSAANAFFYVIPPVIGFFVMIALMLISILRAGRSPANILFAVICFLGGIINIDMALVSILRGEPGILWIDRAVHFMFVFIVPAYIHFVHLFLGITGRRWLQAIAYGCSFFLLLFIPSDLYISGYHEYFFGAIARAGPAFHVFSLIIGATVTYCLITLSMALKVETDNQRKNRIKYILGGMGVSSFLLLFNVLPVSGYEIYPLGNFSFIPAVFLAYGVLKYDLLDIGSFIKRGTIYFILTGILTSLYVLIIYIFNALFMGSEYSRSYIFPFFFALLIVLIFNPLKQKVQVFIDRLFFRGKYDYQQILKEVSGEMASLMKFDQIKDLILNTVSSTLQVAGLSLLICDWPENGARLYSKDLEHNRYVESADSGLIHQNHPLVAYFERRKEPLNKVAVRHEFSDEQAAESVLSFFDSLAATLVVPMIHKDRLRGMLALGQKKSDEVFVHEDLELLVTMANQSVIAVENAKSYEAIELFNRDLEKKVEERTQALRQALTEKERTQQQLIQSESLAAIGQLVAGTAHELNNPLATASSLVQTGLESLHEADLKSGDLADLQEDLAYALKEMKRAGAIVRSLLDLSRQTKDYFEPVNMNRVIEDSLRVLFNQYKYKQVEIERDLDESMPDVEGNFANLGQVFINVIQNALQALSDGSGRIVLQTRHDASNDLVVVVCRDNGAGIDEADVKNVFKPFFTTKAVGQGTGLGLYICHEIVKKHGGVIHVSSNKGQGTLVTIEIPCKRRSV
jgi:two-component system NtrC family sensor kinase